METIADEKNYDGSVVINTELDNSGFEKGSDKLLSALKDLTGAVDNLGDNMMSSFERLTPLLQEIGKNTSQIYKSMTSGSDAAVSANEKIAESFQDVSQAAQGVATDIGKENIPRELSAAEKAASSLSGQIDRLAEQAKGGFKTDAQLSKFSSQVDAVKAKISELRAQMSEAGEKQLATPDYAWMQETLDKANESLNKLLERQIKMDSLGVKESSQAYKSLAYDIEQAKAQIADLEGTMQSMREDGTAFISVGDTDQFRQASAAIDELAAKANALPQKGSGLQKFGSILKSIGSTALKVAGNIAKITFTGIKKGLSGLASATKAVASGAKTALGHMLKLGKGTSSAGVSAKGLTKQLLSLKTMLLTRVKSALISSLVDNIKSGIAGLSQFSSSFNGAMSRIKNSMGELAAKAATLPQKATGLQKFSEIMKKIGAEAVKLPGKLAKITFAGIGKGLSGLAGGIKAVAAGAKNALGNLTKLGKGTSGAGVSAKGLTRQLLSLKTMLLTRVKSALISSLVDNIKNGITGLAQFSSSFNGAMSRVKNSMGELGANISVTLAGAIEKIEPIITSIVDSLSDAVVKVNALFASLSGQSSMTVAKKQTDSYADSLDGATKSAKKLNAQVYGFDKLNKRSSNSSSSSSSGAGKFGTEDVSAAVPSGTLDFIQKIKDMISGSDWNGLGEIVADGLNSVIASVDGWVETIRQKGVVWTGIVAGVLNGLLSGFDWKSAGKTIGDGLNAVAEIINTGLTAFDFRGLGDGVGNALNGLFDSVNWSLLGTTFANKWNTLISLIFGIISSVDWTKASSSAADFINGYFSGIDWSGLGMTIGAGINGLVELIFGTLAGVDWVLLGESVASGVMSIWNTIDWANAGKLVSDGVIGILDGISAAIESIDWQKLGSDVATFVGNIDWSGVFTSLSHGIGAAFGGLTGFLWGLIKDAWEDTKKYFKPYFEEYGDNIIGGLWAGICDAFSNAGQWIYDNIFTPFMDGFKKAFGIHSPSTEMATMGGYLVEGLKNGITNGWKTLKSRAATLWSDFKRDVSNKWASLKTTLKSTSWTDVGSNLVSGLKSGISSAWSGLKSTVSSLAEGLTSGLKNTFGIHSPSKVWEKIGKYLPAGLEVGIEGGEKSAVATVSNLAKSVNGAMTIDIPSMSGIGSRLQAIAGMLSSSGGLQIPSVAAGTSVPYRLRTSTPAESGGASGLSESLKTLLGDQSEYSSEIIHLLKKLIDLVGAGGKATIDASSIAEMVSTYQSNRERSFGGAY